MSSVSSIFEFLSRLLDFMTGIFSSKKEDKANLWSEILDCRARLSSALAEGRITDVAVLRKELDALMKRYSRSVRDDERDLRRARRANPASFIFLAIIAAIAATTAGCSTTGRKKQTEVLVIGERIHVLEPGSDVSVPQLVPPARKWYLVDDVAILQWLGIPVDYGSPGPGDRRDIIVSDVRDGAMSVRTYSYDFKADRWVEVVPR